MRVDFHKRPSAWLRWHQACSGPTLPPPVKSRPLALALLSILSLAFAGCETVPEPPPVVAKPKPVAAPVVETEREYTNISVSEAKGVSSPFRTEHGTVFPENKMGYRLVLTGGVSMPNLIATEVSPTEILVQALVCNRLDTAQTLDITFAVGEDRESYHAKGVVFPADRARDIKFKLSQQATQNLCLIVTRSK